MTTNPPEHPGKRSAIVRGEDGAYRWTYDVPMLGDFSMLFAMWKVMGIALCAPVLLLTIMGLMRGEGFGAAAGFALKIALLALCFMLPASVPAYLIVAALYGWNYAVRFEMDERGIRRKPVRVVVIGLQMRLMDALGLYDRYAECGFDGVKRIRPCPHLNLITLQASFAKHRIHADTKDFDFVLNFIASRCPRAKIDR